MAVLRKIRIGTDITLGITVMASGHAVDWNSQDIKHVYAFSDIQGQPVAEMSYEQRGSTLRCVFHAEDQNYVGAYRVIIEFNDGSAFSSTLDMPAFEIVRTSEEADIDTGEIVLDIDGSMRFYSLAEVIAKLEGLHTEVKAAASAAREASDNANAAAKKANDAAALANSNASKAEASNKVINDNERKRIAQETARESAEAERKRAELERQKGDESIAIKEAERERNEEVRETNEQTREDNELERRNAESARNRAETQRATSETTRISNETSRQAAENKRVAAETLRQEAETSRVNVESERVTEFARLKKESEEATKAASAVSDVVAGHTEKINELGKQVIYDVTTNNNGVTFDSLSALLSSENLSTLIPESVRSGGMSIRFVQTSDNKYVQYSLMSGVFNTSVDNWQGVDNEPTVGSDNLVKSGGVNAKTQDLQFEIDTIGVTYKEADLNVAFGSLWNGMVDTSVKDCLYSTLSYSVIPGINLRLIHANDIKIRIAEFDANNAFIKQTEYSKIESLVLSDSTKFVKIAASYSERGVSDSNPVKLSDYKKGDFGMRLPAVPKFSDTDIDNLPILNNINDFEFGKYMLYNGQVVPSSENNALTSYIPCQINDVLEVFTGGFTDNGKACIVLYDNNKKFLVGYSSNPSLRKITITNPNTAYVRCIVDTDFFGAYLIINKHRVFNWNRGLLNTLLKPRLYCNKIYTFSQGAEVIADNINHKFILSKEIIAQAERRSRGYISIPASEIAYDWTVNNSSMIALVFNTTTNKFEYAYYYAMSSDYIVIASFYGSGNSSIDNRVIAVNDAITKFSIKNESALAIYPISRTYFTHGSDYNGIVDTSSASYISFYQTIYIPINYQETKIIEFLFNGRADTNKWRVRLLWFDEKKKIITRTPYSDVNTKFDVEPNAKYFRISLYLVDSNGEAASSNLQPGDLGQNELMTSYSLLDDTQYIISRNADKQSALDGAGFKREKYEKFCFAHISDIHGENSLSQFLNFEKVINEYFRIQFGIITGDFVFNSFLDTFTYISDNLDKVSKPILLTIGNHEVGSGFTIAEGGTDAQVFDKYIAPFYSNWGVTIDSENKKSYYYKDFSSYGINIRLIVLNQFETPTTANPNDNTQYMFYRGGAWYSQEQLDWFVKTIKSAPNGYAIMVAKHMPENKIENTFNKFYCTDGDTTFGSMSLINNPTGGSGHGTPIEDIVNAYQNNSSINETYTGCGESVTVDADFSDIVNNEFICYIGGHHHADYIGTLQKYPNQIFLAIECDTTDQSHAMQSDLNKVINKRSMDAINIVSVDRNIRRIGIVRVGADANNIGEDRRMMSIPYYVKGMD